MMQAVTKIPVVWNAEHSVADRLLGVIGRPGLDQLLAETQVIAAKRRWPLKQIKVDHYEDPEEDWKYLVLTLDFDCPRSKARTLWVNYLKVVAAIEERHERGTRDILVKGIHYDFESDP